MMCVIHRCVLWQMRVDIHRAQEFSSLIARGIKLSLNLVVLVRMLRYRLPDGSRRNSLLPG